MSVIPGAQLHGIAGVHLYGAPAGRLVDITVDGTTVAGVLPHDPARVPAATSDENWLDLHGYTMFPAAADPHAHLDKALSHDLVNPPAGDLDGAIASWVKAADGFTEEDILDRARRAAWLMLAQGTTAVRTHVDVYPSDDSSLSSAAFRGIRALTRLREELAGLMTLQIVALVPAHTPDDQVTALTGGALDAERTSSAVPRTLPGTRWPRPMPCWMSPRPVAWAVTCTPTSSSPVLPVTAH
ncbi:hypothetical protein [Corynebacterium variabile]|uniref:hypothetical protein n=1 Tax=Corynebacterium variabile TaxID=1727 RepID=UPI003F99614C